MLRDFRKPLVIAAPKIGLKHPRAVSALADFAEGTSFKSVIQSQFGSGPVKKVVLCSGKVAFDIEMRLEKANLSHTVQVIRLEEIAPFPVKQLQDMTAEVSSEVSFVWVQEECMNQGAFQFAKMHVDRMLAARGIAPVSYVGRTSIHSFASGAPSDNKL